jgi:hypothetical protein
MIDDPLCLAGSVISANPALGPDDMSLRSFEIFDRDTAQVLTTPDTLTNGSRF